MKLAFAPLECCCGMTAMLATSLQQCQFKLQACCVIIRKWPGCVLESIASCPIRKMFSNETLSNICAGLKKKEESVNRVLPY